MDEKRSAKTVDAKVSEENAEVICYRLRCAESGNGLSHYIMYGDLPQEVVNE